MITRRNFLKKLTAAAGALALAGCAGFDNTAAHEKQPNIIFILVDDLGARDLGCYGSEFYETPNIDRLAAESMKFTNAYSASPVCSPTRASIHTGKYPARMGINFILNDGLSGPAYKLKPPHCETEMKLCETTFADELKDNGYNTFFAGKWHLGEDEKFYPQYQGFDVNIGGHKAGQPATYFYPYKSDSMGGYFNVPGLDGGEQGEYLTDRLTNETINYIERNRDRKFLAFLSFYSVHTPLEGKPHLVEKYKAKAKMSALDALSNPAYESKVFDDHRTEQIESRAVTRTVRDNAEYAAMVESVDQNVGRLLDCLERNGLSDNTVVIFTSDNGGLSTALHGDIKRLATANSPLRAGKGWLYEGGIRVPLIIRSPKCSSGLCHEPVTSVDFYPTVLDLAKVKNKKRSIDGVSLAALLCGQSRLEREDIFWHIPHYHSSGVTPCGAVLSGGYKLIEYFEDDRFELFDLSKDESETNDISAQNPYLTQKLLAKLVNWRKQVNAAMPVKNKI